MTGLKRDCRSISATFAPPSTGQLRCIDHRSFLRPGCCRQRGLAQKVSTACAEPPRLPRGFGESRPVGKNDFDRKDGEIGFVGADQMGICFTCGVCETRVSKRIRRKSYEEGVCLVQCPGCKKHHVIADNLGMYSGLTGKSRTNVEEMAREKGESFTRVNSDVFELEKLLSKKSNGQNGDGSKPSSSDNAKNQ